MSGERITINDVAAAAGVSRQTVTRAMNEMADVSPATRERVLRLSEELGYRPSRFASNMARQKARSIGLVLPTFRSPYYTDLAADVLDVAAQRGWTVAVASSEQTSESDVLRSLAPQVDVIVGYLETPDPELRRLARGLPVVFIERMAATGGMHSVVLDFEDGMAELVTGLRERGARRFAMIDAIGSVGGEYSPSSRRVYLERQFGPEEVVVVTAPETLSGGADAFVSMRAAHPAVDTVVAFNDMIAMGALQGAHRLGTSVPEEMRIVGVDGLTMGEATWPALTSLSIDREAVAEAIAEVVTAALDAQQPLTQMIRTVVPHPIWRSST